MTDDPSHDEAAIARAYAEGKVTVAGICARFGLAQRELYRIVDAAGVPRRANRAPLAKQMTGARLALVRRLYRRFRRHLDEADERRAALGLDKPDEVAERDARTMSVLARTLEKVIELDEEGGRPGAEKGAAGAPVDEADVERMRAELARRFERLRRSGGSQRLPGGPEPE